LAVTVHEDLARAEGVPALPVRLVFMILIAVVIALAMKIVGILMITSLLIIPAAAARRLAPEVGTVLSKLETLKGARLVRLSGSGATCFAVFATPREALRAAILLAEKAPDWWVTAGILGDPRQPLMA